MIENKNRIKSFSLKEWLSFLPLFIGYVAFGFYVIFLKSPLLAYFYIVYIVCFYIGITSYLFCTKCPHYGEKCPYIFVGLLSKKLFNKKESGCSRFEKLYPAVSLIVLIVFPMLFVLNNLFYLSIFLSLFVLMFGIVKPYIVCPTCKNVNCIAKSISNKLKGNKIKQ